MVKSIIATITVCYVSLSAGCGSSTNLFKYAAQIRDKKTFDNLLASSQAAYDDGRFDDALSLAEQAFELDSNSEELSVLTGYIYLSKAGIGPFELAKNLVDSDDEESQSSSGASKDTSDMLGSLNDVIGLDPADQALIGTRDVSDPAYPVIVPKCAEQARSLVEKLTFVNKAVEYICPYVDSEAKVAGDLRHNCDQTSVSRRLRDKAHFLWAFSHLTEAMAFNTVLLYKPNAARTGGKSNLELRMLKISQMQADSATDLAALATAVQGLDKVIASILPTTPFCSSQWPTHQLKALLNDMYAVNAAFSVVPGIPKKVTNSIAKSMVQIEDVKKKTAGSKDAGTQQSQSLKGQFTKNVSKILDSKFTELDQKLGSDMSDSQKQDVQKLCSSYTSIGGGSGSQPALCGKV